jgi:TonB-linked SusC/RagA family outer membrane protein
MDPIVCKKYVDKPSYAVLLTKRSLLSFFFIIGGMTVYAQEKKDSLPVTDTIVSSKKALGEVVVTALGVKRAKRDLTFSSQEVKGEDLLRTKEPNLVNALAGKVSGVQITSSSGTPGASSRIVIRGAISPLGDNQALFVIDGVPINNDETSTVGGGAAGSGSNRLVDIDPSIIESMNVLKGAAATALYGSAGARGVVIITTKSGGMNKQPVITVSSDLSFEKGLFPEKQSKYSQGVGGVYYDGETQKTSSSWGAPMDSLKLKKYDPYDFFKTGVTTNTNIGLSGGNGTSSYFMSYSYFDQKGIVPKNQFKRHSVFFKYTTKVSKNLTTTFQIGYSNSNQNRLPEGASNGPLFVVLVQPVSYNPYPYLNPDGSQRLFRYSRNAPLWAVENENNNSVVNRFLPVFTANYNATPWLTITERIGADIYSEQTKYIEAPSVVISLKGKIIDQASSFRQFNHDLMINAHKEFNKFDVSLLLGNNLLSSYNQTHNVTGSGVNIDGFDNVSSTGTIVASEAHYLSRKVGFYAQANIDYNRFLILSLTGRYDGSSVLESSKRYYPYGSAAMGFVFSEFFSPELANTFNFGKVRVSYANVGNEQVGPYALSTPYILAQRNGLNYPFQGQSGFLQSATLGNEHLKNETVNETEVGLELKFLKNRISFEGSYFSKKLHDGIIPGVSISNATGFSGTTVNTAKVENKGIELLLDVTPVRTKNFSWDVTLNYTRIRNKVLALYPGLNQLGRLIVGQPYNVFFGTRYQRTDKGEMIIGANGMPVIAPEQGIVGNVNPDWLGGLNNTFRYKQLSLSFFFDVKKGGDVQNDVESAAFFYGTAKVTEKRGPLVIKGISEVDNKPNTVAVDAQAYYQSRQYESTIEDGTYIKLRNVSLAYDLKSKFLQHTFFKSALVSVTGRNLWIYSPHFTGADPEVSSYGTANGDQGIYAFSTPTSRSFNFSLKLGF